MSRQVLLPQASAEISSPAITAFARLMRAHALLRRELQSEVLSPQGLTINDFEALLHLSREEGFRLRRVDLAQRLTLSPSGVTRLLDGLQEAGLVEKAECSTDARVTYAVLTATGVAMLERLRADHVELLRSLFSDSLDEEEVAQLAELLGRLPGVEEGLCAADADA
ncbi:MAG: winged helix-turn-helix transcriptional regulator [Actinobacteria bacterium]|nr:winged helix-turn-helix transcriptional regulator [Actinomycetota bacterium]